MAQSSRHIEGTIQIPHPLHGDKISQPLEDSDNQIPSSPGQQRCQMLGVCPGRGRGGVEALI